MYLWESGKKALGVVVQDSCRVLKVRADWVVPGGAQQAIMILLGSLAQRLLLCPPCSLMGDEETPKGSCHSENSGKLQESVLTREKKRRGR